MLATVVHEGPSSLSGGHDTDVGEVCGDGPCIRDRDRIDRNQLRPRPGPLVIGLAQRFKIAVIGSVPASGNLQAHRVSANRVTQANEVDEKSDCSNDGSVQREEIFAYPLLQALLPNYWSACPKLFEARGVAA